VPTHPCLDLSVLPWPVKRDQVTCDLRETGRRVGIRLHAHLLRNTFASHLIERGTDPFTVARLMGHGEISSLIRYVAVQDEAKRPAVSLLD
jgi:integrase/recombinase XerD